MAGNVGAPCIAVIPARGGSRRVPRKNIRLLLGRPSIAYTIDAALESKVFDRIVVTTDDEEIAAVARDFGAEVPFLRSAALSDDVTPVSAATADALDRAGEDYTSVAQLMPNCPLRSADDIRMSFARFLESGADSQISVTRFGWQNPWWAAELDEKGRIIPRFPELALVRSQDLPALFCPTGAVWWGRAAVIRERRTFHVEGKTGWEMPWQRAVDIDTEADWEMAEQLLRLSGTRELSGAS